jgi:hypothetical protein
MLARCRGRLVANSGGEANEHHGVVFYHPTFGAFIASTTDSTAGQTPIPAPSLVNLQLSAVHSTAGLPKRAVAACLQLRFLGPELYRMGKVAAGIVPGQFVWSQLAWQQAGGGQTIVIDNIFSQLETSGRMPEDSFEINWVPGSLDEEFHEAQYWALATGDTANKAITASYEEILSRTNFLAVAWSGLGTGNNPIELVSTSIIETVFDQIGTGASTFPGQLVVSTAKRQAGGGGGFVNSVINYLQSKDARWYVNSAMKVSNLLGGAPMRALTGAMSMLTVNSPTNQFRLTY